MHNQTKASFLFYTFTLFVCLNLFCLGDTAAQEVNTTPVAVPADSAYTYESIEVEGVDFLALTASSDFEDYAGYTRSPDDGKVVAFTIIDGVFMTYDFPGSQETRFYALGNNGDAAGYYVDSDGHHRGVVLRNGELQQFDFDGSVQTEIYGISDATGTLTGNYIDDSGIRRGFSGDEIIEFPGASETYADFVNSQGGMVGSYVNAEGIYQPYIRTPTGRFVSIDFPQAARLEYFFVHGINDAQTMVARTKVKRSDVSLTYVGTFQDDGLKAFQVPDSVSTDGYNINQDGSIVGHYDTPDGGRHGFIARPAGATVPPVDTDPVVPPTVFNYTFETIDVPGADFLAVTASSDFEDYAGYTLDPESGKEVAFTLIDGVFSTHDFPGSQKTHFYALGNDGRAAGHYQDSEGLYHGVILEDGELRQFDFPGSVQTEIYGISDATGVLTGNFIDASGVRRGFSGDIIVEYPGAAETYADFVNASGRMVGSYVDAEGIYHAYARNSDNRFTSFDLQSAAKLEYFFLHGINDIGTLVGRAKRMGEVPRTYVGTFRRGLQQLQFPGSVSTEGWNINQDHSIVGHYESSDGRVHGFIARLAADTDEPVVTDPVVTSDDNYTYETIDVSGVDYLAVTASSDFGDYAGYTLSADGEKEVAFTIIDGDFERHDFPGSQKTHFYALGNDGRAAGHYQDSNGLYHGVILENGELRQYDFRDAIQTFIYGISDATGALTGNWIDASGVHRGFSGDEIIEFPGASETHAHFVNASGGMVGSYVDAEGIYHPYVRTPAGRFVSLDLPRAESLEFYFVHGINDARVVVSRAKPVDDVPRTYVGTFQDGLEEFKVPGSVSTEGWNINQDGSIVGYYESAAGRTHGFIARPAVPDDEEPVATPTDFNYIFESIDVPGVAFLALTASSDFEDYAGYTRSPDDGKVIAFTLIDGVFTTYDFPGSQETRFYALGNNGDAAGYYVDSDGHHRGVVLRNGELQQFDFDGSVQTEIYGISDATGALTGNYIDDSGIRRGFSGDETVEAPGAPETFADFVNASGRMVGSYIDAEGVYHPYARTREGRFLSFDLPQAAQFEYFFLHGINDAGILVGRSKRVGDVPRTSVGSLQHGLHQLKFPGSVSTEGWNINQDGSVVGHYDTPDGRRHGFIARPTTEAVSDYFGNVFNIKLAKGLNMISVPLAPPTPMTAKSLAALTGATTVITLDAANQQFVGWTPSAPDDGFAIEGGQGYIVNVSEAQQFAFVGSQWTNQTERAAAAPAISVEPLQEAWAFVVGGHLAGKPAFDGYQVIVRNLRTDSTVTAAVQGDYFAAANADLARRSIVQVGDVMEVRVIGPNGNVESDTHSYKVTPESIADAVLSVRLDDIGKPKLTQLLQNFPNPFNPETWIPYQLETSADITLYIYDTTGGIVRTLDLGFKPQGFYMTRSTAAYWDGRNNMGEQVASGVYFYSLHTPDFSATRKMLILK